jgi:hypothetical protein
MAFVFCFSPFKGTCYTKAIACLNFSVVQRALVHWYDTGLDGYIGTEKVNHIFSRLQVLIEINHYSLFTDR